MNLHLHQLYALKKTEHFKTLSANVRMITEFHLLFVKFIPYVHNSHLSIHVHWDLFDHLLLITHLGGKNSILNLNYAEQTLSSFK